MITKETAESLYDLVTSNSFKEFIHILSKNKMDLIHILVTLKDNENNLETFKRIQGQLQMIDYIINTFNKDNFDSIIEKGNRKNTIGNTM